jgi:hypothetical protein
MSAQAASISSLISTLLLTDYRVLRVVWDAPFTQQLDWPDLREQTYLAYQPWVARLPDHVFDSAWRLLIAQQKPDQSVLLTVLKALGDEFLELRHSEVRIRSHLQGAWQQGVISRQSSLPILAINVSHGQAKASLLWGDRTGQRHAPWMRQILPLPRAEDALVADYIEQEGLHETHLHLNGSTHAEICWLRALRNSRAETRDFVNAWTRDRNTERIRELVGLANPALTPKVFHKHLRTASFCGTCLRCKHARIGFSLN